MFTNNFIDVIKTLSKDEFRRFGDFVSSPYHNSNKSAVKLYDSLKKYYPLFDNRNFTKEKLYQKVFGAKSYNDQVMRNLMSDSLQLAYAFLSAEAAAKAGVQNSLYLLRELRLKKLNSLYEKNMNSHRKIINEDHSLNFMYFEHLYKTEGEIFLNELVHNRQESVYPVVVRQSEYLTYDYISKLINHLIDMAINEEYFNVQADSGIAKEIFAGIDIEKILAALEKVSQKEYTVLSIFYYRVMTVLKNEEKYFIKFKELFFENSAMFERGTNYNLVTSLETYCIGNIKNDPAKYRNELHQIHLKSIGLNIVKLQDEDYLSLLRFWNIFINSVEIGKVDWAENFVKEYSKELDPEIQDGAASYADAIILYKRKNYGLALEKLNRAKLKQDLFKLGIKTFYLRIYYESGDFESASFALDSFKQFLYKNKKINESYREGYLNFASIYHDLIRVKSGEKNADITEVRQKLENIPQAYHKMWLAKMFDELS